MDEEVEVHEPGTQSEDEADDPPAPVAKDERIEIRLEPPAAVVTPMEVRERIIELLAAGHRHREIANMVNEEYGTHVTSAYVRRQNPMVSVGERLPDQLHALFHSLRSQHQERIMRMGIAHQPTRMQMLQLMADDAYEKGNIKMAAQLLEQAAREMGGAYTNKSNLEIDDNRNMIAQFLGVTIDQLPRALPAANDETIYSDEATYSD